MGRDIHRVILGEEALLLSGSPVREPRFRDMVESRSNHFLMDLAGNAFPSTPVIALLTAIMYASDGDVGAEGRKESSSQDVDDAMEVFMRARD